MLPTYRDGDKVLVASADFDQLCLRPGDVVLIRHPFRPEVRMVKRIQHVTDLGRLFVIGDNLAESTDSRSFGPLRPEQIIGQVIGHAASGASTLELGM